MCIFNKLWVIIILPIFEKSFNYEWSILEEHARVPYNKELALRILYA
jgi:hypothetical protein